MPAAALAAPGTAPSPLSPRALPRLQDRYELDDGRVLLTGVQALVRLLLDQHRSDRRQGLRTGTLVSGYQGSPLGGFDQELARQREVCRAHDVVHVPGLNEELGATAAWGSQLAAALPGARFDGVLAMWYGKAPGLDRATDALRHGNHVGVGRAGGALAVVGDDPSCKSSTLPSASEATLAALGMPVFFPGTVQDVLDLGLHAYACSRASGLWCGLKVVTEVADAVAGVAVGPRRVACLDPEGAGGHVPSAELLAPGSLELERSLVGERAQRALQYARANEVNRIHGAGDGDAWLGIVAGGTPHAMLLRALADLGLDEDDLARVGVRVLRLGMIWPLEAGIVRRFAAGLDEILVLEDKRAFVEAQLKEVLYGVPAAPPIVGKRDEAGAPLVPESGALDADAVARIVGRRLAGRRAADARSAHDAARHPLDGAARDGVTRRLEALDAVDARPAGAELAQRSPFFCSGCPHSRSLKAPAGTLVGGGIGCHTMVVLNPAGKGELTGLTQMGGEGAQWIGMAPWVDRDHLVQNLGDGTFFHSGSLAVRAAVASGVNVTYKLLHNEAVAMTGGQRAEGSMPVPELTRLLELEGVRRIIVTSEDPKRYRGADLAAIAEVRTHDGVLAAQEELAAVPGVTVLIHDQACAAQKRRLRKRGRLPEPAERVVIDERVCEGCGDCGAKSGCLSVVPVETEFGRKTQVHQASCNKDYSCLEGDCPSFLTVVPPAREPREAPAAPPVPEPPSPPLDRDWVVRMVGVGGTGVVTVNQVLAMAALIDGRDPSGLDQTGLSQKGGPVVSDLRIAARPGAAAPQAGRAGVDLLLGFDLLGACAPGNLAVADPERTAAVVSTAAVPTGRMVVDPSERYPERPLLLDELAAVTRPEALLALDAQGLAESLWDDHLAANVVLLGAAYQRGLLPVSAEAIERALRLNGAAVERNLAAFQWGRACAAGHRPPAPGAAPTPAGPAAGAAERALIDRAAPQPGELRRLVERRVPELRAYQDLAYAERYVEVLERVAGAGAPPAVREAAARHLFDLMAYKDEYEVARLHLAGLERHAGAKVWFHLHPPFLRALGVKRKLKLGRWFVPVLRVLRTGRRLRGTALDPFGRTEVRRTERALVGEYLACVDAALGAPEELARELCELPGLVRGYEEIKLRGVTRFRRRAEALRRRAERVGGGNEGVEPGAPAGTVHPAPSPRPEGSPGGQAASRHDGVPALEVIAPQSRSR